MIRFPTDLYLILDPAVIPQRDLLGAAQEAIRGGVRMIQFREKNGGRKQTYETAVRLRDLTRQEKVILIINDDLDLAMAVEADGVHLGQEDLPIVRARAVLGMDRIIGGSAHTMDQALSAQKAGADYLGIGPIYPSPTKQARPPLGPDLLSRIRSKISIPLFAIGGISEQNVREVLLAGADGVACISAVLSVPGGTSDIRKAAERLLEIIRLTKAQTARAV
jgi:thiamine-phosphate pyrophosphorylase